ncbi:MAG: nitroreductase family protein [Spirochaetes bacterium]|nr:nitroreductase family protein [Spirochaetota bacterium]
MNIREAVEKRRAYRNLKKGNIDINEIKKIVELALLAPSCFNNQPWRVVACISNEILQKLKSVYSKGNEWCYEASAVLAIWSKKDYDCIIKDRFYYSFDTGIFVGFLILLFTELGYVAHPIAGFSPQKVKELLGLENDSEVITLIIIGEKDDNLDNNKLNKDQIERELNRPERKNLEEILQIR